MSDEVAPNVQAMRAALDRVFSGKLRQCINGVWVTLENAGDTWRMDLLSAGRCLTERQAREFTSAAGATADLLLTSLANGAVWKAHWSADAKP